MCPASAGPSKISPRDGILNFLPAEVPARRHPLSTKPFGGEGTQCNGETMTPNFKRRNYAKFPAKDGRLINVATGSLGHKKMGLQSETLKAQL